MDSGDPFSVHSGHIVCSDGTLVAYAFDTDHKIPTQANLGKTRHLSNMYDTFLTRIASI